MFVWHVATCGSRNVALHPALDGTAHALSPAREQSLVHIKVLGSLDLRTHGPRSSHPSSQHALASGQPGPALEQHQRINRVSECIVFWDYLAL